MSNEAWYTVYSKPHKEEQVNAFLTMKGIETFYPTLKVKPTNPRCSTLRPYFPRYLFVRADLTAIGESALQWVPGAVGLVQFDSFTPAVPDHLINHLRQYVKTLVIAEENFINSLRPGDPLRIKSGPLAGYEGIFDTRLSGSERVQILLKVLNRTIRAKVTIDTIERLM
jgi:transcription antitermination factor NusG